MEVDFVMPKVYPAIALRAVCYYRGNSLTSNKVFFEYSLSGNIVQAIAFFSTACLVIDKIEFCDPISNEVIHTEEINGPGKVKQELTFDQWLNIRKEERSFLARYSNPLAKQTA